MFVDVWDPFNKDKNFYNSFPSPEQSSKTRLGRILDEGVRKDTRKQDKCKKGKFRLVEPIPKTVGMYFL